MKNKEGESKEGESKEGEKSPSTSTKTWQRKLPKNTARRKRLTQKIPPKVKEESASTLSIKGPDVDIPIIPGSSGTTPMQDNVSQEENAAPPEPENDYEPESYSPFPDNFVEVCMPSPEHMEVSLGSNDVSTGMADIVDKIAAPRSSVSVFSDQQVLVEVSANMTDEGRMPCIDNENVPSTAEISASSAVPGSSRVCDDLPQVLEEVQSRLKASVPQNWVIVPGQNGISVSLRAVSRTLIIQRSMFVGIQGDVEFSVHGKDLPQSVPIWSTATRVELTSNTVDEFMNNTFRTWNEFRMWEICKGIEEFQSSWNSSEESEIDYNAFRETRYKQTCRSKGCSLLVRGLRFKRCSACQALWNTLYNYDKAMKNRPLVTPPKRKGDAYLNTPERKKRFKSQRQEIRKNKAEIERLRREIDMLLKKDSVELDEDLSGDIRSIISDKEQTSKLTDLQKLFIEQQLKAASIKSASAMRWHPAIIRLALSIKTTSSATYELLRGVLRLPSERQLFDYSHAIEAKDEIHPDILDNLAKDLEDVNPNPFQKQHVLSYDEIHLKKNLVYKKSTGEMVGYVKLNEVDAEIKALEKIMDDESMKKTTPSPEDPPIVTKMLTYMVSGVCTGTKGVVACYGVNQLTAETLGRLTWEVTGALEVNGMQVVAFVSDGAGPNKAFYQAQKSMFPTDSGTVFCTSNRFDLERPVYLISDPPHLLKTTRNCLHNSGRKNKKEKYVRYMMKEGQPILWDTVVKLYNAEKSNTVRDLYKLTQAAVQLNSYSVMNVSLAARVLSRSVSSLVRINKWAECEQFAVFVETFNDLFDMLNGAYAQEHTRKRNDLLAPYRSTDDFRLDKLLEIWAYLEEWSKEVATLNLTAADKALRILSPQTLQGWERSIKGFRGAVIYILKMAENDGDDKAYILARKFCQDDLEHYFGKQRSRLGGNTHPDFYEALGTNRTLHVQKELGILGPKRGNAGGRRSALSLKELSSDLKKRTKKVSRSL